MSLGLAEIQITDQVALKEQINRLDENLEHTFSGKLEVCRDLSRVLVSFQGNKSRPSYRWYKYKEGFSASLIDYFLNEKNLKSGTILDPFAGSGTTLFVTAERGLQAEGIELLPICQQIIKIREILETRLTEQDIFTLQNFISQKVWETESDRIELNELRITGGAYSAENKENIENLQPQLKSRIVKLFVRLWNLPCCAF